MIPNTTELSEETALLSDAVQRIASDIAYVIDKSGSIRSANDRFWTETGLSKGTVGPAAMLSVIAEDMRPCALRTWSSILAKRRPMRSILRCKTLQGEQRFFSVLESPYEKGGDTGLIFGIGRDVTEEYQLEDRIWTAQEDRNASVEYALRSSLGLVKGYVYSLRKMENMPREKRDEFARVIADEVDSMSRNIDNLLLCRNGAQAGVESVLFDLEVIITDVLATVKSDAQRRNIELHQCSLEQPVMFYGHPVAIARIVGNLLDFCLLRVTHSGHITVSLRDSEDYVEVLLSDNGANPTPEQLSWLTGSYRDTSLQSSDQSGSRFEVEVARLLAESLGGGVMMSAQENGGMCLNVMLPRVAHRINQDTTASLPSYL